MHISLETNHLSISWSDNTVSAFPYLWLRDTDPAGFHPQTGERTFDLTNVALDIKASAATIEADMLVIEWPDQTAPSRFPLNWIRSHQPGTKREDSASVRPQLWRANPSSQNDARSDGLNIERFPADALLQSDTTLSRWLRATKRYGLTIVDKLDDTIEASTAIAARVGHLRRTNFGTTFEVISKQDPNNLAYTAEALPLHTDLSNQDLPPGYQFLHCLANEANGGGSLFSDGFAVATDLFKNHPEFADRLAHTSVPFRFHDTDTDIRSRKYVISRNAAGEIDEICFNAHLADVLDLKPYALAPYYAAYRQFMSMTRSAEYVIKYRLQAGEMVVFDNRRVLHGRDAFEPGSGMRHLHGCYVDRTEWDSRLRVLSASGI